MKSKPQESVLVVDDEEVIRDNVRRLLELEGYAVFAASGGQEGLALARKHRPTVVVCDLVMPDLDGYGVLKGLRAAAETADIPVVLLTASAGEGERDIALRAGAAFYVTKPFDLKQLLNAVRRACAGAGNP
jgi:CheY-like chemotaxis protein